MASRPQPRGEWTPWGVLLVESGGDGAHVYDPQMNLSHVGSLREIAAEDLAFAIAGYFWEW